ncbi:callose synthase 5 [Tanacetum coccineum]
MSTSFSYIRVSRLAFKTIFERGSLFSSISCKLKISSALKRFRRGLDMLMRWKCFIISIGLNAITNGSLPGRQLIFEPESLIYVKREKGENNVEKTHPNGILGLNIILLIGSDISVMTPYYSEETLYSKSDLDMENEDGISIMYYLQKIFPVRGMMYYRRALKLQAFLDIATDI